MPLDAQTSDRIVALVTLGVVVEIRVSGALASEAVRRLRRAWSRCLPTAPDALAGEAVVDVVAEGDLEGVIARATTAVTLAAIEERAGSLLMLHAASVATASGRTAVLAGPSGAGKTTASATLGRHWGYVTDEVTGVAPDGGVVAAPKPLAMVQEIGGKRSVSPDELGLRQAPADLRLGRIGLLTRRPGARPGLRVLGTAEAVVRLAEHTSYLRRLESPLDVLAGHVERSGGAVEVVYAESSELVALVEEMLR